MEKHIKKSKGKIKRVVVLIGIILVLYTLFPVIYKKTVYVTTKEQTPDNYYYPSTASGGLYHFCIGVEINLGKPSNCVKYVGSDLKYFVKLCERNILCIGYTGVTNSIYLNKIKAWKEYLEGTGE